MSAPFLRDYQSNAVGRIRGSYASGHRRVLFQLPTGGGKTVVFSRVIDGAVKRGKGILVLAHRQEILDQIRTAVELAGVECGIIAPDRPETDAPVQIAMVATIARRLDRWRDRFDFIVIDEAHHAIAGSWVAVLASQTRAKILGVTATPERLDGRGLGEIFDDMVIGPTTAEMIKDGWLCPFVVFEPTSAPDLSAARIRAGEFAIEDTRAAMNGVVIGAAVHEYQRICHGVPAVAFCVDVAHSQAVAERFLAAGVSAAHIDGQTPASERRAAIAALGSGELQILCNCGLISEGVDVPAIGAVLMLRPTASLALFLQMSGRALRPARGKQRAVLLDFSGNVSRHGMPDAPREWSLDSKPRRQRAKAEGPRLRKCPECNALNRPAAHACSECGTDLRTARERREIEIALQEAQRREEEDAVTLMSKRERIEWAGQDEPRLRLVARLSGYQPGWVFYKLQEARGSGRAA
jgi:DNA repair protein RadD